MNPDPKDGRLIPSLAVTAYFIWLWKLPFLPPVTWYFAFGLALTAYLVLRKPFNPKAASLLILTSIIGYVGALVSLLRAPEPDQALWNTFGYGIAFFTFLLFLPVLTTRMGRQVLLLGLITTAVLWAVETQKLVLEYGSLYYSTFAVTGADKNNIGFCFALGGTALLYGSYFWKSSLPKLPAFLIRAGMVGLGIFLFYNLSLIYARSALLAALLGVSITIAVVILSNKRLSGFVQASLILGMLTVSLIFLLPRITAISPYWDQLYDQVRTQGADAFSNREILLRKGVFIITENPFIGVGLGGTKYGITGYEDFPDYYIHNSYLTDWAEMGILGLISLLIWIVVYLKELKKNFFRYAPIDQLWSILILLLFFDMLFLDLGSIRMIMFCVLAGIYGEYSQAEPQELAAAQPAVNTR